MTHRRQNQGEFRPPESGTAHHDAPMGGLDHALHDRQAAGSAPLEARVEALTAQIDAQGIELGRMKSTSVQLRETNRALREAAERGVSDPQLVNKSLQAELDALRAARAAEVAELDGILAELKPLIGEDTDA